MSSAQGANPTSLVPFEQDATPTTLPPPYTGPTRAEEDADEGDEEYDQPPRPSIHINASTTIQGSNNIIPSMPLETAHILATVMATLNDARGWGGDGSTSFARTDGDAEIRVILASPQTVDALCVPLQERRGCCRDTAQAAGRC